ncbi:IscA/HesB family protein [Desulfobotulus sp.]|jgi:Fe-S cluster assembly iron-binding protein IscA|uniref:IscA/HesB family protein n=1 Tax=Desulfobotulus sp. TaxID=1940337 RepID=UPI002A36536A|nr:IscA/HesB family protein [Desulfobotulus sp.]MDY0164073.1 IscA/HesB family protein [Desulfobotulus sp.]
MFTVTPDAQKEVAAFFQGKEIQPIRIFIHGGGCGGPMVAMALDEEKESDVRFDVAGIPYVVEKDLFEAGKPFEIAFNGMGFAVNSSIKLEGGGGCSGCSSSGSCGC